MGETEQEKFRSALGDTMLLRCRLPLWKHEPGSSAFRAETPGQRVPQDRREIVGRALTTTDLPMLLVQTSRRSLMEAFEAAEETGRKWAGTGIAVDFKKSTAIGLEGEVKPKLKAEYGEYTEGRLAENAEEYTIQEYGRKMVISRQALINDDLNALTALPRMYGEQTAEMVGDVAYSALLKAPAMGDGLALFHASHKNLYAGKGGVPTVDNLGAMVTGMKLQKDSFDKTITIQPKYFLAPVALEVAAEQFFLTNLGGTGAVIGTGDQPLIINPYGGSYFTRIYDRRLDLLSPTDFYLAAQRGTVVVYFLGGVESPYIEEQINFNTDGLETKVRMDVGAKAMRWVTLAKAASAA
jgi:hypothetical protein